MNPKEFEKLRASHAIELKKIEDDWSNFFEDLANRLYKKTYDTQLIRSGNTYYKRITDPNTGRKTIGASLEPNGEFFPIYDENSDARWKYETIKEYQDSVMYWVSYIYEHIIKVPAYGFSLCGRAEKEGGKGYIQIVTPDTFFEE